MLESLTLGALQGIVEWLPVSSEGFLTLAQVKLFGSEEPLKELIRISLFLHLGTFLAALFYFFEDVLNLSKKLFKFKQASPEEKNIIKFLILTTIITAIIGGLLLIAIQGIEERIELGGQVAMGLVGVLLLVTGGLQLKTKKGAGVKTEKNLRTKDGILLGIMQGFAVLPGLSRSGLTVAGLLLSKFDDALSLRLSFLMSLPIVLGGNVALNMDKFIFNSEFFWGLLVSFVFGFITIHYLLKVARKVNFAYFVLVFGALTTLAAFI
ncbi:MAG: undecaprenyl-diphosphate phosphatase [Candidatus Spechtbacterales bacterium]|nr:undecaprenyl-diphosphate phosphatase [Candidatus Spechtbacterales bacterium]